MRKVRTASGGAFSRPEGLSRSHRRSADATAGWELDHCSGMAGADRLARRVAPAMQQRALEAYAIMKLLPLDTTERIEHVTGWLGTPYKYKWLYFVHGVHHVTPITVEIM